MYFFFADGHIQWPELQTKIQLDIGSIHFLHSCVPIDMGFHSSFRSDLERARVPKNAQIDETSGEAVFIAAFKFLFLIFEIDFRR